MLPIKWRKACTDRPPVAGKHLTEDLSRSTTGIKAVANGLEPVRTRTMWMLSGGRPAEAEAVRFASVRGANRAAVRAVGTRHAVSLQNDAFSLAV
jgi:hypothetical protein